MKANGKIIKNMVSVYFTLIKVKFISDHSKTIVWKVKESIIRTT